MVRRVVQGDLQIAYTDEGEGPCVLALHGMPGSRRDFSPIAEVLEGCVRLVRLDLPGFGQTKCRPSLLPRTFAQIAEVIGVFAQRVIGQPFIVLGYSFGAPLAALMAADETMRTGIAPVSGLACLAPVGLRPHRVMRSTQHLAVQRGLAGLARQPILGRVVLGAWRSLLRAQGLPRRVELAHIARKLDVVATFDFEEYRAALDRVAVPILVVWAEDDDLVEASVMRELCEAVPRARSLPFATGGHFLPRTRPAELAQAIVGFAAEVAATDGRASK